jgi:hypothetical protein
MCPLSNMAVLYSPDIFWIILRWFQLPLLLQVSFFFIPHALSFERKNFKLFTVFLLTIFLSHELAVFISRYVPSPSSRIVKLAYNSWEKERFLSFFTCWFHNIILTFITSFLLILVYACTRLTCLYPCFLAYVKV